MDVFSFKLLSSNHNLIDRVYKRSLENQQDSRILRVSGPVVDYNIKKSKSTYLDTKLLDELKLEIKKGIKIPFIFTTNSKAEIISYEPGDFVAEHRDFNNMFVSCGIPSVILFYVKTAIEGGETEVNGKVLNKNIQPGDIIIFPKSSLHSSRPVIQGFKVVVVFDVIIYNSSKLLEFVFSDRNVYIDEDIIHKHFKNTSLMGKIEFQKDTYSYDVTYLTSESVLYITGLISEYDPILDQPALTDENTRSEYSQIEVDAQFITSFICTPIKVTVLKKLDKFINSDDKILHLNECEYLELIKIKDSMTHMTFLSTVVLKVMELDGCPYCGYEDYYDCSCDIKPPRVEGGDPILLIVCMIKDKNEIIDLMDTKEECECMIEWKICDECIQNIIVKCPQCNKRKEKLAKDENREILSYDLCRECKDKLCKECIENNNPIEYFGTYYSTTRLVNSKDFFIHNLNLATELFGQKTEEICHGFNVMYGENSTNDILKGFTLKFTGYELVTTGIFNSILRIETDIENKITIEPKSSDSSDSSESSINSKVYVTSGMISNIICKIKANAIAESEIYWGRDSVLVANTYLYQLNMLMKNK